MLLRKHVSNQTTEIPRPETTQSSPTSPASPLPPFRKLALASGIAVGILVAIALIMGKLLLGLSLFSGLVVGLLMYAGIYSFVTGAGKIMLDSVGGRAGVNSKGFLPQFALLTIGKFVLIGALLYGMTRLLHVDLLQLLIGFLMTQIVITVICVRNLDSTKRLG